MKTEKPPPVLVNDLRRSLKTMMQKEIEKLPEYLEKLEPHERINLVMKLIPFIIPKVQPVHPKEGEPLSFD